MASSLSNSFSVQIVARGAAPASPPPGQALLIGTNTADDIRPPTHSSFIWNYSLFESYGGGTFVLDYSSLGAYVIAGSGGHNAPPNFGAAVFDFEDATWKRIDNTNGMPWRDNDIREFETNGAPNYEIALPGVTADAMPPPAHTYQNTLPIDTARGGGANGSIVQVMSGAILVESRISYRSHRFDLATGRWSRLSTNLLTDVIDGYYFNFDSPSVYDPTTNRYYQTGAVHAVTRLPYLDGADWTWHVTPSFSYPSTDGNVRDAWIDDNRRLLLMRTDTGNIRAFQLDNPSAGIVNLSLSGTLPATSLWSLYPVDGAFYSYPGTGQSIYRLTPPSGNPLTDTWHVDAVLIGGETIPDVVNQHPGSGVRHHTRFFYVPALQCFAWIPGGNGRVALIKP